MKAVALLLVSAVVWPAAALARDENPKFPIKNALDKGQQYKEKVSLDIPLYFGSQKTPGVEKRIGEWTSTRNTNSANKPDQDACDIALISAVIALQERARKEGGNAVINIKSLSKVGDVNSASEYICTSGKVIARVQLRGTVVKLGKAPAKKK